MTMTMTMTDIRQEVEARLSTRLAREILRFEIHSELSACSCKEELEWGIQNIQRYSEACRGREYRLLGRS